MARYRRRRSYQQSRDIGRERALQHIEEHRQLVLELGGSVADVEKYFFALPTNDLRVILDEYGRKYGSQAQNYAEKTFPKWRDGHTHISGLTGSRLFALLPPRMPLATKYKLIENLWNHVGPRSKKTVRIGLDAGIDDVVNAARAHIEDVVIHYKIPESLEKRFEWLAAGDSQIKQEFLNHLRNMEKTIVVEGARLHVPVLLEHLRSEAGRHTHRAARILKIGNHELELLIDKTASGVAVVDPMLLRTTSGSGSLKWLWWMAAAIAILYFLSHMK